MYRINTKSYLIAFFAFYLIVIITGCALKGPYKCYLGMYHGRVYDVDTGEPIEGAVIHVAYRSYGASAAGAIGTQVAVRETLSGADGEYIIPADTVMHKCFKGKLHGRMQIFKPGYGYKGKATLSCPDHEKEKIFSHEEPKCKTVSGKYLIWGLPKLKTKDERVDNVMSVGPSTSLPFDNQRLLINAINEERRSLGLPTGYTN